MSSTKKWLQVLDKAGRGALIMKLDWASAYKHIAVRPEDIDLQFFSWLGMDFVELSELGTRSFFRGSLSAPHSIFSHGSLTLMRSFFEFLFSLVAQTLVAQPVVR
jgi:hypothetical protein